MVGNLGGYGDEGITKSGEYGRLVDGGRQHKSFLASPLLSLQVANLLELLYKFVLLCSLWQ
ncbi:unnamed protein product [Prunus armeniaca]|uniref:Uncharacterized protein n=1 Tax=Prunus armeniaca TaxID=36596 RepID=A0A6J5VK13_PRUAR|nr:unnamed protein product [Prunus armeniaca]